MLVAFARSITLVMRVSGRFVVMATGVVRPVAMILRRPFDLPGAIALIPARQTENLRAEQGQKAEHREEAEVGDAGVHGAINGAQQAFIQGRVCFGAASRKTSICWPT